MILCSFSSLLGNTIDKRCKTLHLNTLNILDILMLLLLCWVVGLDAFCKQRFIWLAFFSVSVFLTNSCINLVYFAPFLKQSLKDKQVLIGNQQANKCKITKFCSVVVLRCLLFRRSLIKFFKERQSIFEL